MVDTKYYITYISNSEFQQKDLLNYLCKISNTLKVYSDVNCIYEIDLNLDQKKILYSNEDINRFIKCDIIIIHENLHYLISKKKYIIDKMINELNQMYLNKLLNSTLHIC